MKKTIFIEKIFAIVIALTITLTLSSCEKEEQQPIEPEPDPRIEEFYNLAAGEWELYSVYVENKHCNYISDQPVSGYVYGPEISIYSDECFAQWFFDLTLQREGYNIGNLKYMKNNTVYSEWTFYYEPEFNRLKNYHNNKYITTVTKLNQNEFTITRYWTNSYVEFSFTKY